MGLGVFSYNTHKIPSRCKHVHKALKIMLLTHKNLSEPSSFVASFIVVTISIRGMKHMMIANSPYEQRCVDVSAATNSDPYTAK